MKKLITAFIICIVTLTGCATQNGANSTAILNYGTIIGIQQFNQKTPTVNGTGMLAGAAAGGILGNQIGKGKGRKWATALGAVVGAGVGANVGNNQTDTTMVEFTVQEQNGNLINIAQPINNNNFYIGQKVQISKQGQRAEVTPLN